MPYLLDAVYLLVLLAALPWLVYAAVRQGKYREGFRAKFWGHVPRRTSPEKCIWFHAVSVGEVNLLGPLIEQFRLQRPRWQCVVSTTTMTGMALARKKYADLCLFYCPLDFSWAVRTAVGRIQPDVLVLVELELWPNLIRAARRSGARIAVVNGRLSEHSCRGYRWLRPLVGQVLKQIDLVAVQEETYAQRFRSLGAKAAAVHVTGSMKYDGAQTDRRNPITTRLKQLAGLTDKEIVFLAGSTQAPEEAIALQVFRELRTDWPRLRLVLVPRHPHRFEEVARLLEESGLPWERRTSLVDKPPADRPSAMAVGATAASDHRTGGSAPAGVLLVDVVGELAAWWGTAQIAFVGGSLGSRGGQNMIEPAAYGAAVCFGPHTHNFRDIVSAMLRHQAAEVIGGPAELTQFVRRCLQRPEYAAGLGNRAKDFVLSQLGATQRTFQLLTGLMESDAQDAPDDLAAA